MGQSAKRKRPPSGDPTDPRSAGRSRHIATFFKKVTLDEFWESDRKRSNRAARTLAKQRVAADHTPHRLADMALSEAGLAAVEQLRAWLREALALCCNEAAQVKSVRRAMLLTGGIGVGKSLAVRLVATELGARVVTVDAGLDRSPTALQEMVGDTARHYKRDESLVILVENVDGLSSGGDRSGVAELARIVASPQTRVPIVCVCTDPKFAQTRLHCRLLAMLTLPPPDDLAVTAALARAAPEVAEAQLLQLASTCRGDMRQAWYRLDALLALAGRMGVASPDAALVGRVCSNGTVDRELTVFEKAAALFRGEVVPQLGGSDLSMLGQVVFENYARIGSVEACADRRAMAAQLDRLAEAGDLMSLGDAYTCLHEDDLAIDELQADLACRLPAFLCRPSASTTALPALRFPSATVARKLRVDLGYNARKSHASK